MTSEEMQKAMEFIINQQAQASAKIDALAEAQKEAQDSQKQAQRDAEKRWRRSDERWTRTEARLHALLSHARKQERKREQERKISAPPSKPQSLKAETRNKTETDKRLQALAELVERQIRERRVGNL